MLFQQVKNLDHHLVLRSLACLEANPLTDNQMLLTVEANVVTVVPSMPEISVWHTISLASNVTRLATLHHYAEAPPVLHKTQQFNSQWGRGRAPRGRGFNP